MNQKYKTKTYFNKFGYAFPYTQISDHKLQSHDPV